MKLNRFTIIIITILFMVTIHYQNKYLYSLEESITNLEGEVINLKEETINLENELDNNNMGIESPQELMDLAMEEQTSETVTAQVTAYAPLDNQSGICAQGDPTVTATGTKVRRGIIAVDPKKIPYGSKVYVPGYGEAIAEDTGGALRNFDGVAIDILVDTYQEALDWGKQTLEVEILRRGRDE